MCSIIILLRQGTETSSGARPQYVMFPQDTNGFAIDDQFYVGGSGLLVKPVTSPGAKDASVYLAENQVRTPCIASFPLVYNC